MNLEMILFFLLFFSCGIATITDIKKGKIYNKLIMIVGMIGIVVDGLYLMQNQRYIIGFTLNFIAETVLAIAFYTIKVWGAGDAKLWMLINVLFPFGIYYHRENDFAPGFRILVLTFTIAYIYVLIETVILYIFLRDKYKIEKRPKNFKLNKLIWNWILGYCAISNCYFILQNLVGSIYEANRFYIAIIAVIILVLCQKWLQKKVISVSIITIALIFQVLESQILHTKIQWQQLFIIMLMVVIAFAIKEFANSFNYVWIKTPNVKSGMIISYVTILQFQRSRSQQLPISTDETTKSRITVAEAEAIKRWENSKYGKKEIMIVRHMPFAIFFVIGIVCYLQFY